MKKYLIFCISLVLLFVIICFSGCAIDNDKEILEGSKTENRASVKKYFNNL